MQLGRDDEAHMVMDANSMELYDENDNQYFFAGDRRDTTTGTNNRTAQNSLIKKSGSAYVTDVSITAQNRQNSTVSVQFTGSGPLS